VNEVVTIGIAMAGGITACGVRPCTMPFPTHPATRLDAPEAVAGTQEEFLSSSFQISTARSSITPGGRADHCHYQRRLHTIEGAAQELPNRP
jgi:hypothetical protein